MSQGIKETLELIKLLGTLKTIVMKHLGDGFNKSDIGAIVDDLMTKPEVKKELEIAIEGLDKIALELKDLSAMEKLTLISAVVKAIV